MSHDKWMDMRIKHLEFIKDAIERMSSKSATLKNVCMGVITATIGIYTATENASVLLYVVPIVLTCAALDAGYLRLERAFRDQFDSVRKSDLDSQPDFLITPSWKAANSYFGVFFSWSVSGFYVMLSLILFGIFLVGT